jgi:hypothetical protein
MRKVFFYCLIFSILLIAACTKPAPVIINANHSIPVNHSTNNSAAQTINQTSKCGNDICEPSESCRSCLADCSPCCGDGTCFGNETCITCPADCGACVAADSCTDTDGGNTPSKLGTVSTSLNGISYSHTDFCNGTVLTEFYCSGVKAASQAVTCESCLNGACAAVTGRGDLFALSNPKDAMVYVDNAYKGYTPKHVYNLSAGSHFVRIEKKAYLYYNTSVEVSPGVTAIVNISLALDITYASTSCSDTDDGNNPYVNGTVSGYEENVAYSYTDYCDDNFLKEYYCVGVNWGRTSFNCKTANTTSCNESACV